MIHIFFRFLEHISLTSIFLQITTNVVFLFWNSMEFGMTSSRNVDAYYNDKKSALGLQNTNKYANTFLLITIFFFIYIRYHKLYNDYFGWLIERVHCPKTKGKVLQLKEKEKVLIIKNNILIILHKNKNTT